MTNYVLTNINILLSLTIWNQFFSLYSTIIVIMLDCDQVITNQYGKCFVCQIMSIWSQTNNQISQVH